MTVAMTLAQVLLSCFEDSLTVNPPAQICLRAGEAVRPQISTQDDECCSGLAWVRIANTLRNDQFDSSPNCINHMRTSVLEMGVARCMPTPPPEALVTCDQWTAVALQLDADHAAMEAAVCCLQSALATTPGIGDPEIRVGDYEPRGPEGRCISGTMLVEVVHGCACGTGG